MTEMDDSQSGDLRLSLGWGLGLGLRFDTRSRAYPYL